MITDKESKNDQEEDAFQEYRAAVFSDGLLQVVKFENMDVPGVLVLTPSGHSMVYALVPAKGPAIAGKLKVKRDVDGTFVCPELEMLVERAGDLRYAVMSNPKNRWSRELFQSLFGEMDNAHVDKSDEKLWPDITDAALRRKKRLALAFDRLGRLATDDETRAICVGVSFLQQEHWFFYPVLETTVEAALVQPCNN